jgi:lysophospholipase L1-like esterase
MLPVAGSVCLIAAGREACLNRIFLARKPVVFIGLISFPLYLWHWPLLAFPRIVAGEESALWLRVTGVLLGLFLAWLTYCLVEKRLRFHPWRYTPLVLFLTGVALIVPAGIIRLTNGLPGRFEFGDASTVQQVTTKACSLLFPSWSGNYCLHLTAHPESRRSPRTWVLFTGDSHAGSLTQQFTLPPYPVLPSDTGLVTLANSGCPPLKDFHKTDSDCPDFSQLQSIAARPEIHQVVLSGYFAHAYSGEGFGINEQRNSKKSEAKFTPLGQPAIDGHAAAFTASLAATLETWRAMGKQIWLVYQVPELMFPPQRCLRPLASEKNRNACLILSREVVDARQHDYRQAVAEVLKRFPEVHTFDPLDYLCDAQSCRAMQNGKSLYADNNHLGWHGSELMLRHLLPMLEEQEQKRRSAEKAGARE